MCGKNVCQQLLDVGSWPVLVVVFMAVVLQEVQVYGDTPGGSLRLCLNGFQKAYQCGGAQRGVPKAQAVLIVTAGVADVLGPQLPGQADVVQQAGEPLGSPLDVGCLQVVGAYGNDDGAHSLFFSFRMPWR